MRKTRKKTQMTQGGVIAMSVFALPFLLWGIYSAYHFLQSSAEYSTMQKWIETPATIEKAELVDRHRNRGIGKTKGRSSTKYKVAASYAYEFEGRPYRGDRVSLYTGVDGDVQYHHDVYHVLTQHGENNEPLRCYVNPDDPQQSVLYRDWRWKVSGLHLMHAVLFGGLGLFLIGSSLYYWRKQERGKRFDD